MQKITNAELYINDDGKRMVKYTRVNSKGKVEILEEPYFNVDGSENPYAQDILVTAKKNAVVNKLNATINTDEKMLPAVITEEVEVNPEPFSKKKAFALVAALGLSIASGIFIATFKGCGPVVDNSNKIEQNDETNKVEGAVEYISYGEAIADMAKIGQQWADMGYTNVSQRSLNAMYYAVNFEKFDKETTALLIKNGVISDEPMTIIQDTLEVSSVAIDQGTKRVAGQDKPIIDMSMFCVDDEDVKLVTAARDKVNEMVDSTDKEKVYTGFDDFYKYYCNEEDTNMPIIYNEANKGVNLVMKVYGVISSEKAALEGMNQDKLDYLNDNTGMLDFSSIIKSLQRCMSLSTVEQQTGMTK